MQTLGKTMMTTELECAICGKDQAWHRENNSAHAFSTDGQLSRRASSQSGDPSSQNRPRINTGGDPVLRMALIRKGVITPEDLTQVEAEINATGISHT